MEDVEKELRLGTSQLLAMFNKVIRKVSMFFRQLQEGAVAKEMPASKATTANGDAHELNESIIDPENVAKELEDELATGGAEFDAQEREKQRKMIDSLPLENYAIANGEASWEDAEKAVKAGKKSGTFGVKRKEEKHKRKAGEALAEVQKEAEGLGKKSKKVKSR